MRRSFVFTGGSSLATVLLLFLETMITVRLISTTSYGGYVLLIFVINLLVTLVDVGCKTSITRFLAGEGKERYESLVGSVLIFRLLTLTVVSLLLWAGQSYLGFLDPSGTTQQYILYVPLMLALCSFDELLLAILQGLQAYKQMAVAQVLRGVLRLALTALFLGPLDMGVVGLIHAWNISFAASVLYQMFALPRERTLRFVAPELHGLLFFGFPLYSTRFIWFVFQRVNLLLVGWLAGPASVAAYAIAARIPDALQRLSESFTAVYFPATSSMLANGQHERAGKILSDSLRIISFGLALGGLITVVFGHELVTLLFSERYSFVAPAFGILMLAFQMSFIMNVLGYTLTAAGYPQRSLGKNALRTGLNLAGNFLFIPLFGFTGSAIASLLAGHLTHPVGLAMLRKSGIGLQARPYLIQTLLLIVICMLFWALGITSPLIKALLVLGFIGANLALATVSFADVRLLLRDRSQQPSPVSGD